VASSSGSRGGGTPATRERARQHAESRPVAETILAHAQAGRAVIQDFVPLADSLEWQLGQEYLRLRGNKAFLSDARPVPFVVNNDGTLSRHAAEVFFTCLAESEQNAPLEPDLYVLELGIGVGLFARYFLDHFRALCEQHHKDYYGRLCYIAADRSERMLLDVCRHGVLSGHPGRYRVRLVDALKPDEHLPRDVMFLNHPGKPLRAVFLNYLLDCLPAAALEFEGEAVKQLCVRTCVARNVRLEDYTDLTDKALAQRAQSGTEQARRDLLEVYGLFASEYDYRPVDLATLPYADFVRELARTHGKRILHSWGAIQCLERLLGLLHPDGFILASDYGQTQMTRQEEFEHQRFSLATFVGVNFPLLKAYFGDGGRCQWREPSPESESIHARLLGHNLGHRTRVRFAELFGKDRQDWLAEPLARARECARVGRFELAATYYREALERQPANWVLLGEVSMFLTFSLREVKAAVELARVALGLNPTCSAELWNALGDGLFEWGRTAEARSAYQKALAVNASDVRARYNLGWVYQREKDYAAALAVLAEGLALDKAGEYRERLLQKQAEVLAQQAARHQQEYLLLINLVSKYAPQQDKDRPPERGG
jgi:tetratricopeptide (TPR) repeat protein